LTARLLRNTSVALQLRLQSSSSSRQSSRLCVQCQRARRAVFHYPTFLSPPPPRPPSNQTQTRPQLVLIPVLTTHVTTVSFFSLSPQPCFSLEFFF
jgi:hypothetical protein